VWDIVFWEIVLAGTFRLATPIALAALGEVIVERAGNLNLGIDGIMLAGAFAAIVGGAYAGWGFGLGSGVLIGALMGAVMAFAVLRGGADQIITGIAIALLGTGLATFFFQVWQPSGRSVMVVPLVPTVEIPYLRQLPLVGEALFGQSILTYACFAIALALVWVLRSTRIGLAIRASGDDPAAAILRGVDVVKVRAWAMIFGGAMAGLGGAAITVGYLGQFSDGVTAGRGYVAIAVVIIGQWSPIGVVLGALLFALFDALALRAQTTAAGLLPVEAFASMPYFVTLIVLLITLRRKMAPRALGHRLPD
jgi:simple sugar transport system permease protein